MIMIHGYGWQSMIDGNVRWAIWKFGMVSDKSGQNPSKQPSISVSPPGLPDYLLGRDLSVVIYDPGAFSRSR